MIENRIKPIKNKLKNAVDLKQTCRIYITTAIDGDNKSFYFKQGCLVWASSSVHRFRRLCRLLEQICPGVDFQEFKLREQEISELWEYLSIEVLYKRQQINLTQAREVIQEIITEVLFDCLVDSDRISQIKVIFETQDNSMGAILESPLLQQPVAQVDYRNIIEPLESMVADWTHLTDCLPNHAPVVVDTNRLSESVDFDTYQKLFMYINGRRTFRDLAVLSQQDLLKVAYLIAPLIEDKTIAVQQVKDRRLTNLYYVSQDPIYEATQSREYIRLDLPLIVYVDNNIDSCQQAIKILNSADYQIIAVNDAAKTLIVLLKNQPSLIIIDSNTIDINAYELCAQIKKVSKLENVPIIICRDREQMLDRFKAKMAGVSDFIDKPIEPKKLLTLAQKHTQSSFDRQSLVRS